MPPVCRNLLATTMGTSDRFQAPKIQIRPRAIETLHISNRTNRLCPRLEHPLLLMRETVTYTLNLRK